jgi:creatinine amidohydrolase
MTPSATATSLFPSLVDLDKATQPQLSFPPHLSRMLPLVAARDRAATMMFLAEALKPRETGKKTSTAEMSSSGV